MKKIILGLFILFCFGLLIPANEINAQSEFTVSFGHEMLPERIYSLETHEKYEGGVWQSYKIFQNKESIKHPVFSIRASFCFPVIGDFLYTGIEIGYGFPINTYNKTYNIPALASDFGGTVILPQEYNLEESYSQQVKKDIKISLIPILFKIEMRLPFMKKVELRAGLGIGPQFIKKNIKDTVLNSYIKDFYLYKAGQETQYCNKNNKLYVAPYGEGQIGLNYIVSSRISIGVSARLSCLNFIDFMKTETDYSQVDWWPAEKELIQTSVGSLHKGTNLNFKIELKLFI